LTSGRYAHGREKSAIGRTAYLREDLAMTPDDAADRRHVVAIVRQERVLVPRGDTLIRTGDEVIVLVTGDSEDEVRAILTGA
jgi:Trk K+ transport system NAD-binding subunit